MNSDMLCPRCNSKYVKASENNFDRLNSIVYNCSKYLDEKIKSMYETGLHPCCGHISFDAKTNECNSYALNIINIYLNGNRFKNKTYLEGPYPNKGNLIIDFVPLPFGSEMAGAARKLFKKLKDLEFYT